MKDWRFLYELNAYLIYVKVWEIISQDLIDQSEGWKDPKIN